MDTERSRRHASKLLTYPLTIGSVLHQHSPLTLNNQRLTSEGSRSLAGKFIPDLLIADIDAFTQLSEQRCTLILVAQTQRKPEPENHK